MRIRKFLEYSDEITLPFTLEELWSVRNDPKTEARMLERCKELEKDKYECRPFSGKYLDKNRVPVFFYLGDRIKGDRPLQYALTDDPAKNLRMQLQNREERHLHIARNRGEEIVTDGIQVSSLSPLFLIPCLFVLRAACCSPTMKGLNNYSIISSQRFLAQKSDIFLIAKTKTHVSMSYLTNPLANS